MTAPAPTSQDGYPGRWVRMLSPAVDMSITGLEVAFKLYHDIGGRHSEAVVVAGLRASQEALRLLYTTFGQPEHETPVLHTQVAYVPTLKDNQWALLGPHGVVFGYWYDS